MSVLEAVVAAGLREVMIGVELLSRPSNKYAELLELVDWPDDMVSFILVAGTGAAGVESNPPVKIIQVLRHVQVHLSKSIVFRGNIL